MLEEIDQRSSDIAFTSPYQYEIDTVLIGIECARSSVEYAPAADVAPVVHGRWEEKDNVSFDCIMMENIHWSTYICSECNGEAMCDYAYCPNCGAKMDGGKNDG